MINGKCLEKECKRKASFNYPDETRMLYCFKHKKDNMVNLKIKKCVVEGCNKQCYFNFPNEPCILYCVDHKTDEMIVKRFIPTTALLELNEDGTEGTLS
jgi:hypothetical protein